MIGYISSVVGGNYMERFEKIYTKLKTLYKGHRHIRKCTNRMTYDMACFICNCKQAVLNTDKLINTEM